MKWKEQKEIWPYKGQEEEEERKKKKKKKIRKRGRRRKRGTGKKKKINQCLVQINQCLVQNPLPELRWGRGFSFWRAAFWRSPRRRWCHWDRTRRCAWKCKATFSFSSSISSRRLPRTWCSRNQASRRPAGFPIIFPDFHGWRGEVVVKVRKWA